MICILLSVQISEQVYEFIQFFSEPLIFWNLFSNIFPEVTGNFVLYVIYKSVEIQMVKLFMLCVATDLAAI